MQVVFKNECRSCEIINQMFFSVMFSFSKIKKNGYDINIAKQNYLVAPFYTMCLINHRRVLNLVNHLQEHILAKTVNSYEPLLYIFYRLIFYIL